MADASIVPLAVSLGESVFALGRRAPGLIRPDVMYDNSPVLLTRLVELTVVVDEKPLALPPTRFAQIEQVAGTIVGLKTAPMIRYAGLKPADGIARWLVKRAADNGWEIDAEHPVDVDQLKDEAAVVVRKPIRKTYATLRRGATRLAVVLTESGTPARDMKPRGLEPLFLVRTEFTNKSLRDAQSTKLFARRRQVTGGTQSVPLSAWIG